MTKAQAHVWAVVPPGSQPCPLLQEWERTQSQACIFPKPLGELWCLITLRNEGYRESGGAPKLLRKCRARASKQAGGETYVGNTGSGRSLRGQWAGPGVLPDMGRAGGGSHSWNRSCSMGQARRYRASPPSGTRDQEGQGGREGGARFQTETGRAPLVCLTSSAGSGVRCVVFRNPKSE